MRPYHNLQIILREDAKQMTTITTNQTLAFLTFVKLTPSVRSMQEVNNANKPNIIFFKLDGINDFNLLIVENDSSCVAQVLASTCQTFAYFTMNGIRSLILRSQPLNTLTISWICDDFSSTQITLNISTFVLSGLKFISSS